jgi:hypothetical protein
MFVLNSFLKQVSASCICPLLINSKYFNSKSMLTTSACRMESKARCSDISIALCPPPTPRVPAADSVEKNRSAASEVVFAPDSSSSLTAVSLDKAAKHVSKIRSRRDLFTYFNPRLYLRIKHTTLISTYIHAEPR